MKAKQDKETRLDRIEKGLELLLQGTSELKESQKKTDAQIKRTDDQLRELKKSQDRTDGQLRELKKSQDRTDGQLRELKKSQDRTDGQLRELKKSQDRTDVQLEKTIKKLDEIGRQLGDLGLVQGEVAEDLFYRNVRGLFKKERDMIFVDVKRNLKKKGGGEYDIVAVNGGAVLVIEVKNKLQKRMVDRFVKRKLPKFKEIFSEYRGRRIYGGMGALVVKDDVSRYAEKAGLYVLTQSIEGGAALVNRKNFKAKEFN